MMTTLDAVNLEAGALKVVLVDPDGTRRLVEVRTVDQPGLEVLSDLDRGRVRSALLTVHRQPSHTNTFEAA